MHYDKRPIDFRAQLLTLKSRGMKIYDENEALEALHAVSYFRLAGYLRTWEVDTVTHRYNDNANLKDVIDLYRFDNQLRAIVFTAIQDIEIALRTRVSQACAMQFGAFWFSDKTLFKNAAIFQQCYDTMRKEVERSREDFIKDYYDRYSSPELPPRGKRLRCCPLVHSLNSSAICVMLA